MDIVSVRGGINWRLPAYLLPKGQCVLLQNYRVIDEIVESILGTQKYCSTSIGSDPITAIMPYYNLDTNQSKVLIASGTKILVRDDAKNEFSTLKDSLTKNKIHSSAIRHNVMYIPSESEGLMKFLGGTEIENVGGGLSEPGNFRHIYYMREVDRLFGLTDQDLLWCDISDPETWDPANIDRLKSIHGGINEGLESLYGKLIIFQTYGIWIYYVSGNEENWKPEPAPTSVGCRAPNSIKKIGNEILFLGDSPETGVGVYAFGGSTCRLLTDDVNPLMRRINASRIREACACYHNDLYTLSFPLDASLENNASIDLDMANLKEDGTPAIYGPHTFGFYSSAVLNTRLRSGETLYGGQSDGFVYRESGSTFKSVNGTDGELIIQRFLSAIHNDGDFNMVKRYSNVRVNFIPRGYTKTKLNIYLSYSPFFSEYPFYQGGESSQGYPVFFNVVESKINGTPSLYQHIEPLGVYSFGTAIQIEIINDLLAKQIAFQGYDYDSKELYKNKKVQMEYAI